MIVNRLAIAIAWFLIADVGFYIGSAFEFLLRVMNTAEFVVGNVVLLFTESIVFAVPLCIVLGVLVAALSLLFVADAKLELFLNALAPIQLWKRLATSSFFAGLVLGVVYIATEPQRLLSSHTFV